MALLMLLSVSGCLIDTDADGDGFEWVGAGGIDCDDADPSLAQYVFYRDQDGDGVGDTAVAEAGCTAPEGYVTVGGDCDDSDPGTYPGADELCDAADRDCDDDPTEGAIDQTLYYRDFDGDGYGDPDGETWLCEETGGFVENADDCDDARALVSPEGTELCDRLLDEDCDGTVDEAGAADASTWYADTDQDGYGDAANTTLACDAPTDFTDDASDCDDSNGTIHPGADELCGGEDDDCDTRIDEGATDFRTYTRDGDGDGYGGDDETTIEACTPPSGFEEATGDCDDSRTDVYPGATETCDGADQDCDASVDEDAVDAPTWYADLDGDDHGDVSDSQDACEAPADHVASSDDCDPTDGDVYPGASETCDGSDEDCDANTDEDAEDGDTWYVDGDSDGYGEDGSGARFCSAPGSGYADIDGDCDDADSAVSPAEAEVCFNGVDDDCDGSPSGGECDWMDAGVDLATWGHAVVWTGESDSDHAGTAFALGDVDGDAVPDVLVGAQSVDGSSSDVGAVYVVSGASPTSGDLGTRLAKLTGVDTNDAAGRSVAAPDIDGDGVAEVLVGAWQVDVGGVSDVGAAYLVTGSGTTSDGSLGSAGLILIGTVSGDKAGTAVAGGDFDGDGADDIAIGAPKYDDGGTNLTGAVYLFDGPGSLSGTVTLDNADHVLVGGHANAEVGDALAVADADGDGLDDLLVGASSLDDNSSNEGSVFYMAGPVTGSGDIVDFGEQIVGESSSDYAGQAVAWGDLDGDGYLDGAIGAPGYYLGGDIDGAAYVVYGSSSGLPGGKLGSLASETKLTGHVDDENAGYSVATGDLDGDGVDDLVVGNPDGIPTISSSSQEGSVYVAYGPVSGGLTSLPQVQGVDAADTFGAAVLVGDLDGDGAAELLAGAPSYTDAVGNAGGVFLLWGYGGLSGE